ncbi:amidohydrolase family protein [Bacillus sp. B15-48]|uniref:amidohydrolase family protein n=1 Tax=Bacillus sp. B15-48 TaxID=1548601 RepID=UPI00193F7E02|nr:amidohydrolase family protein [Bacillus sp. B15-48]MBM4764741.1 amidohydrolase family protein [Bacillus sp. B15-48]
MSVKQQTSTSKENAKNQKQLVIDTDIHHEIKSVYDLVEYLPDQWKRYITEYSWTRGGFATPFHQIRKNTTYRMDSTPEDGSTPGSDYDLMKEQLLDKYDLEYGVLTGLFYEATTTKGWYEFAAARASAYNDLTIDKWLNRDKRLLGSITIPREPEAAVREIDRVASHPQMVQVMLPIANFAWGDPYYHPIFEAANRHGLQIGMHLSGDTTAQGGDFLRYYVAWRCTHPQAYMTQTVSMITNGVFDKFPDLKVGLIEGGFEWVPFMMHRMDAAYKGLRQETPWVKRLPSEYFRDNMKFSTQPFDDLTAKQLLNTIDAMGTDKMLMFSTDYPHWDFESPQNTLPNSLSQDLRQKIFYDNAKEFYNL